MVSVAAGHYYQGRLGQRFYSRLRAAGLLPEQDKGFADDAAFAADIGFTDIIKRPTVIPGPYERADRVKAVLQKLIDRLWHLPSRDGNRAVERLW